MHKHLPIDFCGLGRGLGRPTGPQRAPLGRSVESCHQDFSIEIPMRHITIAIRSPTCQNRVQYCYPRPAHITGHTMSEYDSILGRIGRARRGARAPFCLSCWKVGGSWWLVAGPQFFDVNKYKETPSWVGPQGIWSGRTCPTIWAKKIRSGNLFYI